MNNLRFLFFFALCILIPLACMADPWGSKSLGDRILSFLFNGFTLLWCLIYVVIIMTSKRKRIVYFVLTMVVLAINIILALVAIDSSNRYDRPDFEDAAKVMGLLYIIPIVIGIFNIRRKDPAHIE